MDVIVLNKYLLVSASLDDGARARADVDKNDDIDNNDSLDILKFVMELIGVLPITE